MKTEHTPTPWIQSACTVHQADNWKDGENLGGKEIAHVYDILSDDLPTDENEANAAFIVRAVNSHAALVEAVEGLLPWIAKAQADNAFENCAMPNGASVAMQKARAALELEKGTS